MTSNSPQDREALSALLDGEASAPESAQALAYLQLPQAKADWDTYQLIGQSLRGQRQALRAHDPDFVAKIQCAIQAQAGAAQLPDARCLTPQEAQPRRYSANEGQWWRVASLAAVVLVVAVVLRNQWSDGVWGAQPQLAQTAPTVPIQPTLVGSPEMLRDPQLDAMLAAHRQLAASPMLQTPSGFLRNATFEGVAR